LAAVAITLTACGGHAAARSTGPTTTLITADNWTLPATTGPPSTANFCTLLVATYSHEGQLPQAANNKVRQSIVADYVTAAPGVIAAAPPSIAPAAKLYLHTVAQILADLNRVGLNAQKLPKGQLGPLLLDPKIKAAGTSVVNFSQRYCHYTIGG
jgi:hypothetical protein